VGLEYINILKNGPAINGSQRLPIEVKIRNHLLLLGLSQTFCLVHLPETGAFIYPGAGVFLWPLSLVSGVYYRQVLCSRHFVHHWNDAITPGPVWVADFPCT
jgi:hypothetical protein